MKNMNPELARAIVLMYLKYLPGMILEKVRECGRTAHILYKELWVRLK